MHVKLGDGGSEVGKNCASYILLFSNGVLQFVVLILRDAYRYSVGFGRILGVHYNTQLSALELHYRMSHSMGFFWNSN